MTKHSRRGKSRCKSIFLRRIDPLGSLEMFFRFLCSNELKLQRTWLMQDFEATSPNFFVVFGFFQDVAANCICEFPSLLTRTRWVRSQNCSQTKEYWEKNLGRARIWTQGSWVRSAKATSVLCSPPCSPKFNSTGAWAGRRTDDLSIFKSFLTT